MGNIGVGALGGVVLIDPETGLPYKATGGGGGGGAVESVNSQTGIVVLDAEDVGARADTWEPGVADINATGTPGATNYLRGDGSWTVPPNTTYTAITQANVENPASTTAGLITGQRAAQAVATHESLQSVVQGTNVTIDNTDPRNPVINAAGGGGGGVASVNGDTGPAVVLDATDVGARADDWAPTILDVVGLDDELATKADAGVEGLPSGAVLYVNYDAGWAARPTARTDIKVIWQGSTSAAPPTGAFEGQDAWFKDAE